MLPRRSPPLALGTACLAMGVALLGAGCQDPSRPWDRASGGAAPASWPATPGPSASSLLPSPEGGGAVSAGDPGDAGAAPGTSRGSTGSDASSETDAADPAATSPTPPVRLGGPWVRCYGNFHPSGEPIKDVTRLSLLCGPENGMRRLSKQALEGTVAPGVPPVTEPFEARRGECYRVFAVAEATVTDLDVVVRSSRGSPVAADHGQDAWPIVQPDRPFCPLEDDRYTVEVTAKHGRGRFASEIWVLRTPHK